MNYLLNEAIPRKLGKFILQKSLLDLDSPKLPNETEKTALVHKGGSWFLLFTYTETIDVEWAARGLKTGDNFKKNIWQLSLKLAME